mgnify:FL=1
MSLNSLIDKVHINKFAAFAGAGGFLALLETGLTMYHVENIDFIFGSLTAIKAVCGLGLLGFVAPLATYQQNRRYDSLVRKLNSTGYNKDYCEKYMDHPCGRSVVKTALKRTKNFNRYNHFKENNSLNIKYFC